MKTLAAILAFVLASGCLAGCHRSTSSATTTGGGGSTAAATDYRKLTQAELVALIKDKLRIESITLAPDGPNHYKGKMPSPDGTIQLPTEVTVEAERIVIESKGGGMTTRQIITPRGLESELR